MTCQERALLTESGVLLTLHRDAERYFSKLDETHECVPLAQSLAQQRSLASMR